uniref:Uncharacterized LOC110968426 n=1 Tax=Acanthochromis polyacanthus TaxID=80966 RepID=A0A3Q1FNL9_9TELE
MKTVMWFGLGKSIYLLIYFVIKIKGSVKDPTMSLCFQKQLEWSRYNEQILRIGRRGFPTKGKMDIVSRSKVRPEPNLEISPVKEEDTGRFTCKADGTGRDHTLLVVSGKHPSTNLQVGQEATLGCQVKDPNFRVAVEWKKPGGAPHAEDTVDLKPVADSDAGTWTCTLTYEGETYSQSLDIKVSGSTFILAYAGPLIACHHYTTDRKSGNAELLLLGLHWWVWLAVGIGGLVVILLTVFVIVLCKRNRERKQRKKCTPLKPKKYCQCDRQAAAAKPQQGRRREKPSALLLQPC